MTVLVWGLADYGKPRTRILVANLERRARVRRMTLSPWGGVEDKSRLREWRRIVRILVIMLFAYPTLVARFLASPKPDILFVPYLGVIDVLVIWPFARMRGVPVAWDAFLSLYDTIVIDRALIRPGGAMARLVRLIEGVACRAADVILVDTDEHGRYFEAAYAGARKKTRAVLVGAELEIFNAALEGAETSPARPFRALFYGQCIPLHGVRVILEAAALAVDDQSIEWSIIGDGQEADVIERFLGSRPLPMLNWERWVPYETLPARIAAADVCLGIFGDSEKAGRVIPNKVFQYVAMEKPFISRDSSAMRELFSPDDDGVWLIEAGSPEALLAAVRDAQNAIYGRDASLRPLHSGARARIASEALADDLFAALCAA
ncbi:MAG: glycosyltransferase [Alphaproteobacteria bacterium]|nr:glycosyltransferase [Alphaproteobacteria bacterium]